VKIRVNWLAAMAGVVMWTAPPVVYAQAGASYPSRPIRLVVPATPGGGTDILARIVALKLHEAWRQQVIVDNRAGGSGMIGSEIVARADPDGHTLLVSYTGHVTNPGLFAKMPYDTVRDFSPVAMVGVIPGVLVLHPSLPPQSVKEFIAYAKERPGKMNYGSAGEGSATHLATVLFNSMTGISMLHVPYKGSTPALADLLSGQLNLMFGNMASAMPHARSGKLRALAVTGTQRSAAAPELPTVAESGLPGYEAYSWFGMFGPAKMPPAVVNKLNAEVNSALKQPGVRERLTSLGADALIMTPRELGAYVETEIAKWGRIIKASGAKAE